MDLSTGNKIEGIRQDEDVRHSPYLDSERYSDMGSLSIEQVSVNENYWDSDRKLSDGPQWQEDLPYANGGIVMNEVEDERGILFEKTEADNDSEKENKTELSEKQEIAPKEEEETQKNCPVENGKWEGERGDSKWVPDPDYIPQKKNPEQKSWEEILDEYDIDGIDFKEGSPDFGEVSKGNVEIEEFSTNRNDNFDKADVKLAEQKGCTPEEVEKWRKENSYTWHECKDMKTMQKVPSVVHNNVSHRGGISEAKGVN